MTPGRAWVAVAAALAVGALAGLPVAPGTIDWQPGLAFTEPWRTWTAAFVHFSPAHLGMNLGGALLVAAIGWRARFDRRAAIAWFAAWPLTHLLLLATPSLAHYGGLSGVLHAGVAVAAAQLALDRRHGLGAALAAGLVLKVAAEAPWRGPVQAIAGHDIPVATAAHVTGVMAGFASLGIFAALARLRLVSRPPHV